MEQPVRFKKFRHSAYRSGGIASLALMLALCLATPAVIAEDEMEDLAEEAAEEEAEESAEEAAEDAAEDASEEAAEEMAEEAAEEEAEEMAENEAEEMENREEDVARAMEDQAVQSDLTERVFEDFGEKDLIVRQELLIMAETRQVDTLLTQPELTLVSRRALEQLPGTLARFRVDDAYSPEQLRQRMQGQFPDAFIDLNHGYRISRGPVGDASQDALAGGVYRLPANQAGNQFRVGMIDTGLDVDHAVFAKSRITRRKFLSENQGQDLTHGTGVASLLVGEAEGFRGIAAGHHLFAASVFARYRDRGLVATSHDLVAAMDWLISQNVDAINISLAGPANRVVAAAIDRLAGANILLIAAVGNDGPFAEPRYPAAYDQVVGVTAVDRAGRLYSRAGRGSHVDYAGPGVTVDVAQAESGSGYTTASGTSYATPIITGLLLAYRGETRENLDTLSDRLEADLVDLGQPGWDPLYGYGLPGRGWMVDPLPLSE